MKAVCPPSISIRMPNFLCLPVSFSLSQMHARSTHARTYALCSFYLNLFISNKFKLKLFVWESILRAFWCISVRMLLLRYFVACVGWSAFFFQPSKCSNGNIATKSFNSWASLHHGKRKYSTLRQTQWFHIRHTATMCNRHTMSTAYTTKYKMLIDNRWLND